MLVTYNSQLRLQTTKYKLTLTHNTHQEIETTSFVVAQLSRLALIDLHYIGYSPYQQSNEDYQFHLEMW